MRVPITRIDPRLPLPSFASPGAAGFDFYSGADVIVPPGSLGMVPSNNIICVPDGFVLLVVLRSGTPRRTGLISPNGVGIIDPHYCGPDDQIQILVYNPGPEPVLIARGDRIAQGLLMRVEHVEWDEGPPRGPISRGGFGSTGR